MPTHPHPLNHSAPITHPPIHNVQRYSSTVVQVGARTTDLFVQSSEFKVGPTAEPTRGGDNRKVEKKRGVQKKSAYQVPDTQQEACLVRVSVCKHVPGSMRYSMAVINVVHFNRKKAY